jgi:hypothetical protein
MKGRMARIANAGGGTGILNSERRAADNDHVPDQGGRNHCVDRPAGLLGPVDIPEPTPESEVATRARRFDARRAGGSGGRCRADTPARGVA